MFNMFGQQRGYEGELTYRKKIQIEEEIEDLQGSKSYIFGSKNIELKLYDLLENSSGDCLKYILSLIYENQNLYNKYAALIFEAGYQKQKDKKYEKFKKHRTSRNAKEIIVKNGMYYAPQPPSLYELMMRQFRDGR